MWGFGNRFYWGSRIEDESKRGLKKGIVVVFAWMSSQDKHLKNYVNLYSSLGWKSLVCHSQFLNLLFPNKATSFAMDILTELVKELKKEPCPVVFASFSGGPKACMYKVLQLINGICKTHENKDEYQLVRECVCGQIFDSTPADFTTAVGTRFFLHPSILKVSHPPTFATWFFNGISSGLDALFLTNLELQRAEYWQTLYSSASMGAPYLILCSESDDLVPYQIICNFSQRLQSLGADVTLVKWSSSPHVGHYLHHAEEYKAAVIKLLANAASIYATKVQQLTNRINNIGLAPYIQTPEPVGQCKETVSSSNQHPNSKRMALDLNDHFIVSGSMEYQQVSDEEIINDTLKDSYIRLFALREDNSYGSTLDQFSFEVCVPKNVEDWEMSYFAANRSHSHFEPVKFLRRSKL